MATKTSDYYTVKNSSINEPGVFAQMEIMPTSINEPPLNLPAPPVLTALVPNTAVSGSGNLTMRVTGTGFGDYSILTINNVDRSPTFVSSTELTTTVRPSTWGKGTYPVKVKNGPYPSNILNFTFT